MLLLMANVSSFNGLKIARLASSSQCSSGSCRISSGKTSAIILSRSPVHIFLGSRTRRSSSFASAVPTYSIRLWISYFLYILGNNLLQEPPISLLSSCKTHVRLKSENVFGEGWIEHGFVDRSGNLGSKSTLGYNRQQLFPVTADYYDLKWFAYKQYIMYRVDLSTEGGVLEFWWCNWAE